MHGLTKPRVIRVKSWSELPDILEPGIYKIDGATLKLKEPLDKDEARELVSLVKRIDKKYYG